MSDKDERNNPFYSVTLLTKPKFWQVTKLHRWYKINRAIRASTYGGWSLYLGPPENIPAFMKDEHGEAVSPESLLLEDNE